MYSIRRSSQDTEVLDSIPYEKNCDIFSTMCDGPLGQCACLSLISLTQSRFFAFVARPLIYLALK